MEELHIAIIYEESIAIFYPKDAYSKLTLDMQKKLLKSILENYKTIQNPYPSNLHAFVCDLLHGTKELAAHQQEQEMEKLCDLLINTRFNENLEDFLEQFLDWRNFDDTILLQNFPLAFVRKVLTGSKLKRESLILAMFSPAQNTAILQKIMPLLNEAEKNVLKEIFTQNNNKHQYTLHLNYFK